MTFKLLTLLGGPEEIDVLQVPEAMKTPVEVQLTSKVRKNLILRYTLTNLQKLTYQYQSHTVKPTPSR